MQKSSRPLSLLALTLLCVLGFSLSKCSAEESSGKKTGATESTNEQVAGNFVKPAFEKINVPENGFQVDAEKGGSFEMPSGTKIVVPGNVLVDAQGNSVQGKVDFSYREFHDATDLILSGITMRYDSAGMTYDFETAGMMELNATQNGEPVFIREGGSIDVSLASFAEENNYNLYYLDQEGEGWTYEGVPEITDNPTKDSLEKVVAAAPKKPAKPKKVNPDDFTFDFAIDYGDFPELEAFQDIKWQYAGNLESQDPMKNEWAFDEYWTDIKLSEKNAEAGQYYLTLSRSGKEFKTVVTPALEGQNLDKAMAQYKAAFAAWEEANAVMIETQERIKMEANMLRTFQVSNFGIYNCDRFYNRSNMIQFAADFNFDEESKVSGNNLTVYLITGNSRSVFPYYPGTGAYSHANFKFCPDDRNMLVAVVPGEKVAVFPPSKFSRMDLTTAVETGSFTFDMETQAKKIESGDDFRSVLNAF